MFTRLGTLQIFNTYRREGIRMIRAKGTVFILFCLAAIFLSVGCAATKKITKDITGKGGRLKKKIAFLPTFNKTGYGGEAFAKLVRTNFKTSVESSCDDLIIIDSQETLNLLAEIPLLPSGRIDNMALAKLGRALGVSVVLEEGLSGLECLAEKRGIWGLRNTRMLVQLSVSLRGYDTESGAILFEEVVQGEVEVAESAWKDIKERTGFSKEVADRLLAQAMPEISERACDVIGSERWKGYVTSVSGNTFGLTAGRDVGLAEGDVLEVFGVSEPIKGDAGQSYFVSGPKIGELKITKVHGDRAEATRVLGSDLEKSSHVKLKE
jgi:hypothetical protein